MILYTIAIAIPSGMVIFFTVIFFGGDFMETRIAVMGIIVENVESVESLNSLLHGYREYIIGRMGIPYKDKGISVVSIAVDAPQDVISSLAGKVGRLDGISVKTAYSSKSYGASNV
jgi:putative iron-only hydrogenase system regulator